MTCGEPYFQLFRQHTLVATTRLRLIRDPSRLVRGRAAPFNPPIRTECGRPSLSVSVRHRGLLLPRLPPFGEFKDLELMHVGVWH